MKRSRVVFVCAALSVSPMAMAEDLKLPPEVTPAMRAACEGDVRRLGCIDASPTYSEVKSCVVAKYMRLGERCRIQLASAGYSGPAVVPKTGIKTAAIKSVSK